jgi:helix-turn-helix protein
MIDLTADLTAWLGTPEVRALLKSIVTDAVRDELRAALEDELLDVGRAAQMLGMSAGALRKAVERGQVPCERIGNRLRFRRMDLLTSGATARRVANVNALPPLRRAPPPVARPRGQLAAAATTRGVPGERLDEQVSIARLRERQLPCDRPSSTRPGSSPTVSTHDTCSASSRTSTIFTRLSPSPKR